LRAFDNSEAQVPGIRDEGQRRLDSRYLNANRARRGPNTLIGPPRGIWPRGDAFQRLFPRCEVPDEAGTGYGKLLTRLTAQRKPSETAIIRASCARRDAAVTAGVCYLGAKTRGQPGPSLRLSLPGRHLVNSVAGANRPLCSSRFAVPRRFQVDVGFWARLPNTRAPRSPRSSIMLVPKPTDFRMALEAAG
jgi:hypothetical protein